MVTEGNSTESCSEALFKRKQVPILLFTINCLFARKEKEEFANIETEIIAALLKHSLYSAVRYEVLKAVSTAS
jgi:hypothetical protein